MYCTYRNTDTFIGAHLRVCPLCLSFRASSFLVIILPLSFFFFSFVLYLPLFEGDHQMPYTVDDVCKCKNIKLSSISLDRMRRTLLQVCIQWQSYSILTSNILLPFLRQTSRSSAIPEGIYAGEEGYK